LAWRIIQLGLKLYRELSVVTYEILREEDLLSKVKDRSEAVTYNDNISEMVLDSDVVTTGN